MTGGPIVIGIGNPRRRDDGVGPAVVGLLRGKDLAGVALATSLGETDELIDLWDGAELAIVVGAVRAWPVHAGRVHRLAVPHSGGERARAASSHGINLGEAVELARELDPLPGRLVFYAVEAADVGHGVGLTPAVRDAPSGSPMRLPWSPGPAGDGGAHLMCLADPTPCRPPWTLRQPLDPREGTS